jgi:hypothetical protein
VAAGPEVTSGLAVLQQVEIIEGASALVVLIGMFWLLGAGRLVIGRHYDDLKNDRDRWRDLYLDRLRNGPHKRGGE